MAEGHEPAVQVSFADGRDALRRAVGRHAIKPNSSSKLSEPVAVSLVRKDTPAVLLLRGKGKKLYDR